MTIQSHGDDRTRMRNQRLWTRSFAQVPDANGAIGGTGVQCVAVHLNGQNGIAVALDDVRTLQRCLVAQLEVEVAKIVIL